MTINQGLCYAGRLAALSVLTTVLATSAHARGGSSGGGNSGGGSGGGQITAPGQCTLYGAADASTKAQAVLVKQNNTYVFGMTVIGPNSVGNWTIKYSKNGQYNVFVDPIGIPPPGGWTMFVASTNPGEKGLFTFTAEAFNKSGEVCTAIVGIKL